MLAMLGCTRGSSASDAGATASRPSPQLRVEADVFPASRCGECHERAFTTWAGSAHARARTSKVYAAMKPDAACERCHAPLAAELDEAVGCDACHTMTAFDAGSFTLELAARVRYGPLCGLKDHYFHKMGCAPQFGEAEQCGACHALHLRGLPVFTEYEEWQASEKAEEGVACQDCHMPGREGEVAVGAGRRERVTDHAMLGKDGKLREIAVQLDVTLEGTRLEVAVLNRGAAHRIPAGLPGKQLVLSVRAPGLDEQVVFSKVLVDDAGEAPFTEAKRLDRDDRLKPDETRRFTYQVPAKGAVDVAVIWREVSPAIAKRLGLDGVTERTLVKATLPLGGKGRKAVRGVAP